MVANLAPRKMKFGAVRRHGARRLRRRPRHLSCSLPTTARSRACASSERRRRFRHRRASQDARAPGHAPGPARIARHRRHRGMARHRRAGAGAAAHACLRQSRAVSRAAPPSALALAVVALHRASSAAPQTMVLPARTCRTCRFICGSIRCRRSSCCCWARRRPRSRSSRRVTSAPSEGTRAGTHLLPVPRLPRGDGDWC